MSEKYMKIPEIAGFIVARSGSKSIPRKNLQLVGGVPLIVHTFKAALESGILNRVIISTDDDEIIALAMEYGVHVPFKRPAELAGDDVHVMDVTVHALNWLAEKEKYEPDYVMLLQPTSPLRNARDIRAAASLCLSNDADAVVSVTPTRDHPCLAKTIGKNGRMEPFIKTGLSESRRQALPETYGLNGAIYMVKRNVLLSGRSWCPPSSYAYVMPPEQSLDVDSEWDLELIRMIFNKKPQAGSDIGEDETLHDNEVFMVESGMDSDARHGKW